MSTATVDRRSRPAPAGLRLVSISLMLVVLDYVATIFVMNLLPRLAGPLNLPNMTVVMQGALIVSVAAAILATVGEGFCLGLSKRVGGTGLVVAAVVLSAAGLALSLTWTVSLQAALWLIKNLSVEPGWVGQHVRTLGFITFLLFLRRLPALSDDPKLVGRARFILYGLAFVLVFTVVVPFLARQVLVAGGPWVFMEFLVGEVLIGGFGMILFARYAYLVNDVRRRLDVIKAAPEMELSAPT